MTATAEIRNLWGECQPAEMWSDRNPYQVVVPGLGVLIVAEVTLDEPIVRLSPTWRAVLVQPDDNGAFSPSSNHVEREAKIVGDAVEVEMLPNSSGEDRIVVVLRPLSKDLAHEHEAGTDGGGTPDGDCKKGAKTQ